MTLLAATYALENMPVVDLLQASKLIPSDVVDELTLAIADDYDGFNMHAELERVLGLLFRPPGAISQQTIRNDFSGLGYPNTLSRYYLAQTKAKSI